MLRVNRRTLLKGGAGTVAGLVGAGGSVLAQATPEATPALEPLVSTPKFEVLFIRHGESEVNVLPPEQLGTAVDDGVTYPLTLLGIQQVNDLAQTLANRTISAVVTSTRLRCLQTADAIAFSKGLSLKLAPEIVEVNLSGATGFEEIQQVLQAWMSGDAEAKTATGETLTQITARALPFLQQTIDEYSAYPATLVIVAHGGILMSMLPLLFSNVSPAFAATNSFPNTGVATGELQDGTLVCTDWLGLQPE